MSGKLFGYARVSTQEQCLDRQIDILKEYGVEDQDIFIEKMTGSKLERPQFELLRKTLRAGDTVITESMSRLSRNSRDLLNIVEEWNEKGITYISIKEVIDFSTANGKLMLTLIAALSEFERDNLRERVKSGIESARKRGRFGGRPKTDAKKIEAAVKLYEGKGHTIKEITSITNVSQSALYRELRKRKEDK